MIQGSLLACLLTEPMYLSSVVIGGKNFKAEACARAFYGRLDRGRPVRIIHTSAIKFLHERSVDSELDNSSVGKSNSCVYNGKTVASNDVPCPDSIVWIAGNEGNGENLRETLVAGARQGWPRKRLHEDKRGWSAVCQQRLAEHFLATAVCAGWTSDNFLLESEETAAAAAAVCVNSAAVVESDRTAILTAGEIVTTVSNGSSVPAVVTTVTAIDSPSSGGPHSSDVARKSEFWLSYNQLKSACHLYNKAKNRLKSQLPTWPSNEGKRRMSAHILVNST